MSAKTFRLNRLFHRGRCLDVAIDHGVCNEPSFLDGLEDMPGVVEALVEAQPDAIQMNFGQADLLQAVPGKQKPALVMRIDMGNPYNKQRHRSMWAILQNEAEPLIGALQMDAACVVVNLLMLPDEPEVYRACVRNVNSLKRECEIMGMPLMVEPLVMQDNAKGGYMVDGDIDKILPLVRQAAELGADIIKADPCSDVSEYHRVIEIAQGLPVLVRGGGRVSDAEILSRTAELMKQGAKGIVYGRNVIQHPDPGGMTRALMAVVHEGAAPEAALAMIGGK